jgi:hypothetical protein
MTKIVTRAAPHIQFGHYYELRNYYILDLAPCSLAAFHVPVEAPALICMVFYSALKMVAIISFEIASILLRHYIPEEISSNSYRPICTEVRVS